MSNGKTNKETGIGFFQKYLTVWVFLCMVVGVLIGKLLPSIPDALGRMEIAGISIPIAVLIWIMIYPMMLKVDFQSVKQVGKNPKGLFITWIVNWLIKPFTMYGIASLFLFTVFKGFIATELAMEYLAGKDETVLLGIYKNTASGSYRLTIRTALDKSSTELTQAAPYDYAVFRASLYQLTTTPDYLEDAIYSSWREDNRWNINRMNGVWVGDSQVKYSAGDGCGYFYISPGGQK